MARRFQGKSEQAKKIAQERVRLLFSEAKQRRKSSSSEAQSLVDMGRKVAMKYRVAVPSELKKQYCKKCHAFLLPGISCRVRSHKGHMVYLCLACKHIMRFPYKDK